MLARRARNELKRGARQGRSLLVLNGAATERKQQNYLAALFNRFASPQPATYDTCAEEWENHVPAQIKAVHDSPDSIQRMGKWDKFVYTLYHIRARASAKGASVRASAPAHLKAAEAMHLAALLPINLLLEPAKRQGYPLSEWVRQLQKEIDCEALTKVKLEEKVDRILRRGAATELRSSQALVRQLAGPLTDAIIREQRSAVKRHVTTELARAKTKRLRAQHAKLRKLLSEKEAKGSFQEWFQAFGLPPDHVAHNKEFDKKMLENCMALQAHELQDPAAQRPQDPVSDVAVIAYIGDRLQQQEKGAKAYRDKRKHPTPWLLEEEDGMLDVVQAKMMGLNLFDRAKRYPEGKRRQIWALQTRLNNLLQSARFWSPEKSAKVGARLIDIAMETLMIRHFNSETECYEMKPFLEHHMISEDIFPRDRKMTGVVRIHDVVVNQLVELTDLIYLQNTVYDPMVVPPLPWQGLYFGGHLLQNDMVVRIKSAPVQLKAVHEADFETPGLQKIYHSLNCLQAVPWRINRPVLDVVRSIWRSKEAVCGIPRRSSIPIVAPKKRPRFMTWLGGTVETTIRQRQAKAGTVLSTADKSSSPGPEAFDASNFSAPLEDPVAAASASMAGIEPDLPSLMSDADEGTALWRQRSKSIRQRRFMRRQLLVTASTGETMKELKVRRKLNAEVRKQNREVYSQLCDLAVKLAVAESYKKEKAIYYPHNMDFRGRAYTLHPHLTHLGSDICRGILHFAQGKPLGESGLDWLFVQLANSWGKGEDKNSFEGRRQFIGSNLFDILESARAPLKHKWWQQAEDPFQTLAVAMEIRAAIVSGDPATYVSHNPIMMDGSCNGLQHYAALGRDLEGGASVNLLRADKPQDVYTEVAKLVKQSAAVDALNGSEMAQSLLQDFDRRLVKQTVMTSVYGVTLLGAKDQIAARLRERGYERHVARAAGLYAAQKALFGLNQRFREAMRVMAWLNSCARNIARMGKPVTWKTPLGLPIVQPYRKLPKLHVQTTLQRIILQSDVKTAAVNKTKQRSAFPPNYIHSIDSSHMLMTAAACSDAGLQFAGVHDSFWTHAADVQTLNRVLREQFIELYSQPLLENLEASFRQQYPRVQIPELPQKGNLDLQQLLDANYFFS